ncbi:beta/gamma crystallin-related protein [Laspinema palackyanum]|uniref:beta/gamma crystallin-related protein n=1 Tax=Laspinema palackyanum TaxID=3231601 RepID=UPI00345CEFAA|nr:beta/gamma crystallin family protein [Laspinema sp. D2c]
MAKAKLYTDINYQGRTVDITSDITDLTTIEFNDKVSSVIVESGTFTLYSDVLFQGYSVTLSSKGGPSNDGKYPSYVFLGGLNDYFSSIRVNSVEPK